MNNTPKRRLSSTPNHSPVPSVAKAEEVERMAGTSINSGTAATAVLETPKAAKWTKNTIIRIHPFLAHTQRKSALHSLDTVFLHFSRRHSANWTWSTQTNETIDPWIAHHLPAGAAGTNAAAKLANTAIKAKSRSIMVC